MQLPTILGLTQTAVIGASVYGHVKADRLLRRDPSIPHLAAKIFTAYAALTATYLMRTQSFTGINDFLSNLKSSMKSPNTTATMLLTAYTLHNLPSVINPGNSNTRGRQETVRKSQADFEVSMQRI